MDVDPLIFHAGGSEYRWSHVVTAAQIRGEFEPVWADLRDTLACCNYAEEEGFKANEEELQTTSDAFRYEQGLISAEDTEAWLQQRNLTIDDFSDHLVRRHWRNRFQLQLPAIRDLYAPSREQAWEVSWPEVVLGGRLKELALPLAHRVAVALEEEDPPPDVIQEVRRDFHLRILAEGMDANVGPQPMAPSPEWATELVNLEARYRHAISRFHNPGKSLSELQSQWLPLTRVTVERARFSSDRAARETFLCLTQDRENLEDVAGRTHTGVENMTFFLGRIPGELQQRFISAAPGEVLEPVEESQGFSIYRIRDKIEPDLRDPEIRVIVEGRLLGAHLVALVEKHIRWVIRPE